MIRPACMAPIIAIANVRVLIGALAAERAVRGAGGGGLITLAEISVGNMCSQKVAYAAFAVYERFTCYLAILHGGPGFWEVSLASTSGVDFCHPIVFPGCAWRHSYFIGRLALGFGNRIQFD